jgi:hypothetical protein
MLCCLLLALLGGPFLLWGGPRAGKLRGPDCCADNRHMALMISALALIAVCAAMLLFAWLQPVPFRHICSFTVLR